MLAKELSLEQVYQQASPLGADELINLLERIRKALLQEPKGRVELSGLDDGEANILPACLSIVAELPQENESRH